MSAVKPDPVRHPSDTSQLPTAAVVCGLIGVVILGVAGDGLTPLGFGIPIMLLTISACSFSVYIMSQHLKKHELWKEARRQADESDQ